MMFDDGENPRTIFGRVEPMPYHFGIGRLYEVELFHKRRIGRRDFIEKYKNVGGIIAVILTFAIFSFFNQDRKLGTALGASWFVFLAYFIFFPDRLFNRLLMIGHADYKLSRKIERYEAAKAEFDRFVLATELGFWRELRGASLENEVAALFRTAGWKVGTTPTVGDGGVDLKVLGGAHTFWCQCKGYSKPVSVAAVREIAGVCVASEARPVLIVVNGLTKPAADEAAKLGVRVFDSPDLAAMARGEEVFTPDKST
jgi:hypothetical protein